MLRALMEKDNMQEQEDDGNSEKESKGNAKHQQHCKSYENAFHGRIRDSTQPEKAAVSWNTGQQTLCKLKCKEKKERNKQYPKTVGQFQKVQHIHITGISEEKKEAEKTFEIIIAKNFPKLTTDPRKLRVPISYSDNQNTNTKS